MSAKAVSSPRTIAEINKQIVEIKKKIQLSEGQRKAAFEEYETQRVTYTEQIQKLKKEIAELNESLQLNKDENAAQRLRNLNLETVIGPITNKSVNQIQHTLDLQIIDRKKHLDLIRHKIKKKEQNLAGLAKEYQTLVTEKANDATVKMDNRHQKKIASLQNNIHRVEVQFHEADHVRKSYNTIRSSLLNDSSRFESTLWRLEEQLQEQKREIEHLQNTNSEAMKTRATARSILEREERTAMNLGKIREQQNAEYKNLVMERKLELERLERRIFQSGKVAPPRPDTAEDTEQTEDITPEEDQETALNEAFEKLREATRVTSSDEVLSRFQAQRDTKTRLEFLKKNTEAEKRQLEIKEEALNTELERYKFAQERDKEKHSEEILELKEQIENQIKRKETIEENCEKREKLLKLICTVLYNLYLGLKDIGITSSKEPLKCEDGKKLVEVLATDLKVLLQRCAIEKENAEGENVQELEVLFQPDDELMSPSYNALLRRTPLPVQGHPMHIAAPPTTVSEDEEEVPSRGFLKRQAQLVVDAKSRRKTLRIPIRK